MDGIIVNLLLIIKLKWMESFLRTLVRRRKSILYRFNPVWRGNWREKNGASSGQSWCSRSMLARTHH